MRSLLLVRLSAIGDAIHALPALELLRAALPGWKIGWAVEAEAAPLLSGHPSIDALHVIDRRALGRARGRTRALREIGALLRGIRRYDVALDLQGLARSAIVARLLAKKVLGSRHARELAGFAYTRKLDVPRPAEAHAVLRSLALARGALDFLGVEIPSKVRVPRLPPLPASPPLRGGEELPHDFLVLLPGAGKPANRPPVPLLAQVARLVPELPPVVIGGRGDREAGARLATLTGARDLTGQLSLRESASVLARASVVLGGDTGPLHVARALGRPVVALFFAADPARTGPQGYPGTAPAIVVKGEAECAPCCARTCLRPDKVRICLDPLDPERIASLVRRLPPHPASPPLRGGEESAVAR
ncbi:MAG TPA: glycosyltransferase family 9 protein [Planctomycetota bacterium]|nr:glycosyltransferase family 9 protein [Planctomycetota bacterium]